MTGKLPAVDPVRLPGISRLPGLFPVLLGPLSGKKGRRWHSRDLSSGSFVGGGLGKPTVHSPLGTQDPREAEA